MTVHVRTPALIIALLLAACTADAPDSAPAARGTGLSTNDIDTVLAQRIDIRESPTLFTLFAMLNAAGLDDEDTDAMHPVRRAVRSALPRVLTDEAFARAEAFYVAHADSVTPEEYARVALATSGPPRFEPGAAFARAQPTDSQGRALTGLPAELRAFWRAFSADSIYNVHRRAYQVWTIDYAAVARRELTALARYAGVTALGDIAPPRAGERTVVLPNLLMAHDSAFAFTVDSIRYEIRGPERIVSFDPYVFAHAIVTPLLADSARYATVLGDAEDAAATVLARGSVEGIATAGDFLAANVARALTLSYHSVRTDDEADARRTAAEASARHGYALVPRLVEELAGYNPERTTLREFLPRALDRIDIAREVERWSNAAR